MASCSPGRGIFVPIIEKKGRLFQALKSRRADLQAPADCSMTPIVSARAPSITRVHSTVRTSEAAGQPAASFLVLPLGAATKSRSSAAAFPPSLPSPSQRRLQPLPFLLPPVVLGAR